MCKKIKSITTRDLSKSILSIPPLLEDALKLKTHQFFFTTIFLYFPCDIDYYFCVICGSLFPLNFKSTLQLSPLCKNVKKDRLKKSIRKVDKKQKMFFHVLITKSLFTQQTTSAFQYFCHNHTLIHKHF